jgi:hypothetical protein
MGSYNTLNTTLACPRCGSIGEVEIEMHFGNTAQMVELTIGDRYPWVPRVQFHNGGRPKNGMIDGEGYMEYDHCHKDAFLRVVVREDLIVRVEVDSKKAGYVSD